MRIKRRERVEADLDITSFMNLMIILVPVLLMSMVFSHISVLDLTLPDQADSSTPQDTPEKKALELVIRADALVVNYPAGAPVKTLPSTDGNYDFANLSLVLQEIKRQLEEQGVQKRDITILSQPDTDYQTLVRAMDTVRSFQAVVAASVVEAELFPEMSLGDAPVSAAEAEASL